MLHSDRRQSGSRHAGASNRPCDGAGLAAGGPGPADDHLQVSPHWQSAGSVCQTLQMFAATFVVVFVLQFDVFFTSCVTVRPGGGGA